jgi:hypothetical protein
MAFRTVGNIKHHAIIATLGRPPRLVVDAISSGLFQVFAAPEATLLVSVGLDDLVGPGPVRLGHGLRAKEESIRKMNDNNGLEGPTNQPIFGDHQLGRSAF